MNSQATKPAQQPSDSDKPKSFDREVKDMVNTLTSRLADLHKPESAESHHHHHVSDDQERGVRIITLAGNNTGATMRSELEDKTKSPHGISVSAEPEALGTHVNSNFQAVNNSIMFGSDYSTNDPGVHLEISDVIEQPGHGKGDKHGKKGKKKDKEAFKSDHQQSGHSD